MSPTPRQLDQALTHLGAAPGKRIRAQLLVAAAHACGGERAADSARISGEAIELVHSYSLIHDDLPAMDNDDLRRGQPTLHVAFNEATAILVGDGLQARAFELISRDEGLSAEQRVRLVSCLATAAGFEGMVGGQSLDMQATDQQLTLDELKAMHALKTGALIRAALEMGAIVGEASSAQLKKLGALGDTVGLAFQVVDDILDVESDSKTLGKTQGKDAATNKATYVSLLGLEGARGEVARLRREAMEILDDWDGPATALADLVSLIVGRDH